MLGGQEWTAQGLDGYGLIAVAKGGQAAQVEKVSHADATHMLEGLGQLESVGVSLGSFSVSYELLAGLMEEFNLELAAKKGKFDTDPHFWMPFTLKKEDYIKLMVAKGDDEATCTAHQGTTLHLPRASAKGICQGCQYMTHWPLPPLTLAGGFIAARMAAFLDKFAPGGVYPGSLDQLFGAVDIGPKANAYWWDYGQLRW